MGHMKLQVYGFRFTLTNKIKFFNRISPTKSFVRMLRIYLVTNLLNSKISVHYSLLTLFSGVNELDLGYSWIDYEKNW